MVEPVSAAAAVGMGGGGFYLLWQYWKQRSLRLRAEALAEKYSTTTSIAVHDGRMRLLVRLPQVGEVPLSEQRAWQDRDERRNQNFLQLGLLQDPDAEENVENEPDANYQEEQLARRSTWIGEHEPPLSEHATLVSEEHLGAGLILADPEEETPEVNIDERLEREGGASGVVQISLAWDDYNDLDLHLFCPSGERIYFNNKRSDCGGELDVDMNVRPVSNTPVENVVWRNDAPLGTYKIGVHFYKHHRKRRTKRTCKFRLRVVTHGRSKEYIGRIKYGQAMQMVASFALEESKHV